MSIESESSPGKNIEKISLRILVADDDESFIEPLLVVLGNKYPDCKFEVVENGQLLLDKLKAGEYDLVITDNNMPFVKGIEALRVIRASERTKNLSVIVLSADDIKEAVEKNSGVYINKRDLGQNGMAVLKAEIEKVAKDIR